MVWPLLSKNDIISLCEPFESNNSALSLKTHGFSGLVYFDVGSVLLDLDWESFFDAFVKLAQPSHGFSLEKFLRIMLKEGIAVAWSTGKLSIDNYVQRVVELFKASCKNSHNLEISANDLKRIDASVVAEPRARVLKLVNKLKENNFVVGLLSNTTPWHVLLIHEKILVNKNFDVGIFSCDVGFEKPETQIYQIAHMEACKFVKNKFGKNLTKENVYFVDDTPANVKEAIAFGWNARLVNLAKDEILNQIKHNELDDLEFQQASRKRENLLFGEQASRRVEALFGNLLK